MTFIMCMPSSTNIRMFLVYKNQFLYKYLSDVSLWPLGSNFAGAMSQMIQKETMQKEEHMVVMIVR